MALYKIIHAVGHGENDGGIEQHELSAKSKAAMSASPADFVKGGTKRTSDCIRSAARSAVKYTCPSNVEQDGRRAVKKSASGSLAESEDHDLLANVIGLPDEHRSKMGSRNLPDSSSGKAMKLEAASKLSGRDSEGKSKDCRSVHGTGVADCRKA